MVSLTRQTVDSLTASVPIDGRTDAFDLFEKLPVRGQESWRYVDLEVDPADYSMVDKPGPPLGADPFLEAVTASSTASIVDGHTVGVSGDFLLSGLEIIGLVEPSADKFAAGHLAFVTGGVVVDIPRGGLVTEPVMVDVQSVSDRTISFPHVTIKVGENAEASVVLFYRSPIDLDAIVVPQVEIDV
ncbi:MAG: hypothetical protein ACRDWH_06285, partial [Acidimicrobiia bacterium]